MHWLAPPRVTSCPGAVGAPDAGAACGNQVLGSRMGPKAPNSAGASPAGAAAVLRFGSRVPNPGSFPEISLATPTVLPRSVVVPEQHRRWPRSQPPDLALPFRAENIPPGISEFSVRAATRMAARGRTDGSEGTDGRGQPLSCAHHPPAPKAARCQGHGVTAPWAGRGPGGDSAAPPRHSHAASVIPAQAPSLDPSPGHPGAPLASPAAHPRSPPSRWGKPHVLKHVHASLFPISPPVTSKLLMNRN